MFMLYKMSADETNTIFTLKDLDKYDPILIKILHPEILEKQPVLSPGEQKLLDKWREAYAMEHFKPEKQKITNYDFMKNLFKIQQKKYKIIEKFTKKNIKKCRKFSGMLLNSITISEQKEYELISQQYLVFSLKEVFKEERVYPFIQFSLEPFRGDPKGVFEDQIKHPSSSRDYYPEEKIYDNITFEELDAIIYWFAHGYRSYMFICKRCRDPLFVNKRGLPKSCYCTYCPFCNKFHARSCKKLRWYHTPAILSVLPPDDHIFTGHNIIVDNYGIIPFCTQCLFCHDDKFVIYPRCLFQEDVPEAKFYSLELLYSENKLSKIDSNLLIRYRLKYEEQNYDTYDNYQDFMDLIETPSEPQMFGGITLGKDEKEIMSAAVRSVNNLASSINSVTGNEGFQKVFSKVQEDKVFDADGNFMLNIKLMLGDMGIEKSIFEKAFKGANLLLFVASGFDYMTNGNRTSFKVMLVTGIVSAINYSGMWSKIYDLIKYLCGHFQSEPQFTMAGLDLFSGAISSILAGTIFYQAKSERMVESLMLSLGKISHAKQGLVVIFKTLIDGVVAIMNYIRVNFLGLGKKNVFNADDPEAQQFLTAVSEINDQFIEKEFPFSDANFELIRSTRVIGRNLVRQTNRTPELKELSTLISRELNRIDRLYEEFLKKRPEISGLKPEPAMIYLTGYPGVYKTIAMFKILCGVAAWFLNDVEMTEFRANAWQYVWNSQSETGYTDGLTYMKKFCFIDDGFQWRTQVGDKDGDGARIIRIKNMLPAYAHGASLEDKGRFFPNFLLIAMTGNVFDLKDEALYSQDALKRRIDFNLFAELNPKYCSNPRAEPKFRKLRESLLPDGTHAPKMIPDDICIYTDFEGGKTGVKQYDLDSLILSIRDKIRLYQMYHAEFQLGIDNTLNRHIELAAMEKISEAQAYEDREEFFETCSQPDITWDFPKYSEIKDLSVRNRFMCFMREVFDTKWEHPHGPIGRRRILKALDVWNRKSPDNKDYSMRRFKCIANQLGNKFLQLCSDSDVSDEYFETWVDDFLVDEIPSLYIVENDDDNLQDYDHSKAIDVIRGLYEFSKFFVKQAWMKCRFSYLPAMLDILKKYQVWIGIISAGVGIGALIWGNMRPSQAVSISIAQAFEADDFESLHQELSEKDPTAVFDICRELEEQDPERFKQYRSYAQSTNSSGQPKHNIAKKPIVKKSSSYYRNLAKSSRPQGNVQSNINIILNNIIRIDAESSKDNWKFVCYGLMLRDRFAELPFHSIRKFGAYAEDNINILDLRVKVTTKFDAHLYTVGEILENHYANEVMEECDTCFVNLFKQQICKDITGYFVKASTFENLERFSAFMYRPEGKVTLTSPDTYARKTPVPMKTDILDLYYIHKVLAHTCDTLPGDCGLPIMMSNESMGKEIICAMHVGREKQSRFYSAGFNRKGWGTILYQEDIISFLDEFGALRVDDTFEVSEPQDGSLVMGVFPISGKLNEKIRLPTKNKVCYNEIVPVPEIPITKEPSKLVEFISEDGEPISPLRETLIKYMVKEPILVLDYEMKLCTDVILNRILKTEEIHIPRVLYDFETCILGDHTICMSPMPYGTSCGIDDTLNDVENIDKLPYKRVYVGTNPVPDFNRNEMLILRNKLLEEEKLMQQGKRLVWLDKFCLKDEWRKFGKLTRGFSGCAIRLYLHFRRYFWAFFNSLVANKVRNGYSVGINPYSQDWEDLYQLLTQFGEADNVGAGDIKVFDGNQRIAISIYILFLINRWYNGSKTDEFVRYVLWQEVLNSRHGVFMWIIQWFGPLPSGVPGTTHINSVYLDFCFTKHWFDVCDGDLSLFMQMDDYVYVCKGGDDNIFTVAEQFKHKFTEYDVSVTMAKLGQHYTSFDKTEAKKKLVRITEVDFLSRSFRTSKLAGRCVAPLKLQTVIEVIYHTKKDKKHHEISCDNIDNSLKELALHGREVFEMYAPIIRELSIEYLKYYPKFAVYSCAFFSCIGKDSGQW
jgi:hypothetical protein